MPDNWFSHTFTCTFGTSVHLLPENYFQYSSTVDIEYY